MGRYYPKYQHTLILSCLNLNFLLETCLISVILLVFELHVIVSTTKSKLKARITQILVYILTQRKAIT